MDLSSKTECTLSKLNDHVVKTLPAPERSIKWTPLQEVHMLSKYNDSRLSISEHTRYFQSHVIT